MLRCKSRNSRAVRKEAGVEAVIDSHPFRNHDVCDGMHGRTSVQPRAGASSGTRYVEDNAALAGSRAERRDPEGHVVGRVSRLHA